MRAGDIARLRNLRRVLEERTDARPRVQRPGLAEPGNDLLPLIEQEVDVLLANLGLVGIGDEDVGGPDHARGAQRQQDVAVRRSLAAIHAHVHEAMVHRDHQAHAGANVDRATGELGDLTGPRTRRVDDNRGMNTEFLAAALAADVRPDHALAIELEVEDAVVGEDASPMFLRRSRTAPDQLPGIERGVGDEERAPDFGVHARLATERLANRDLLGWNACRPASLEELVSVLGVIPRSGHEEAARVLDAIGRGHTEDAILGDALARRRRILDRVGAPRVEQAVKSTSGPISEITTLHQDG